jgi:hypothetical protein
VLHDSDDNDEFEHDDFARIAGKFNMRLTLHYHNGAAVTVHTTDSKPLEVQFPSYGEIEAEGPTEFFEDKWQRSLDATIEDNEILQEFGGWILYNSQTLKYETIKAPPGKKFTVTEYIQGQTVGIDLGDRPNTQPDESTLNPASPGATYAIASFHTHPPMTYVTGYRLAGPSDPDHQTDNEKDVAGVVYDYVPNVNSQGDPVPPFTHLEKHRLDADRQLYPAGPERRSTPDPGAP